MTDRYANFVRFLHTRAGDAVRTAFRYSNTDWEALYLRGDVETAELRESVTSIMERLRADQPIVAHDEYQQIGEPQASVQIYEEGVLVHIWESDTHGVAISLDVEVAKNLSEFVDQCAEALNDTQS